MTGVETLADELGTRDLDGLRTILASDWLAAHVRAASEEAWDEGWRAGRGRGPGHTDACPMGGTRYNNPHRSPEPPREFRDDADD